MRTAVAPWSVVTVPFPYVERNARKARPALMISAESFQKATGLCWLLMITSAAHESWPGDVPIDDLTRAGLLRPSVVRTAKIAIGEVHRLLAIGKVGQVVQSEVRSSVLSSLADTNRQASVRDYHGS